MQTEPSNPRGLGPSSQGSSFLESVPAYLRSDPEVLHMANLLHREEEKQRRLQEEINQRVEEAARGYRGARS